MKLPACLARLFLGRFFILNASGLSVGLRLFFHSIPYASQPSSSGLSYVRRWNPTARTTAALCAGGWPSVLCCCVTSYWVAHSYRSSLCDYVPYYSWTGGRVSGVPRLSPALSGVPGRAALVVRVEIPAGRPVRTSGHPRSHLTRCRVGRRTLVLFFSLYFTARSRGFWRVPSLRAPTAKLSIVLAIVGSSCMPPVLLNHSSMPSLLTFLLVLPSELASFLPWYFHSTVRLFLAPQRVHPMFFRQFGGISSRGVTCIPSPGPVSLSLVRAFPAHIPFLLRLWHFRRRQAARLVVPVPYRAPLSDLCRT